MKRNKVNDNQQESSSNSEAPNKNFLIAIEFNEKKLRDICLKNRNNLATDINFKNKVFINPDLTFAERELDKKLRIERNERNNKLTETISGVDNLKFGKYPDGSFFYWGIRDGAVKKINLKRKD